MNNPHNDYQPGMYETTGQLLRSISVIFLVWFGALAGTCGLYSCAQRTYEQHQQTKHRKPAYRRSSISHYEAEQANPTVRHGKRDWYYMED